MLISAEDDPSDTIRPRLIAAGADLSRVHHFGGVIETHREKGLVDHWLTLPEHLEQLRRPIAARHGRIRLVVIDPIGAYLGGTDQHSNGEVRAALAGISQLASELRFAVLAVSHLNKASGGKTIYRVTGSLAFVAAARAVFGVVKDPNDPEQRIVGCIKNNLGKDTIGFRYSVKEADNGAPFVEWGEDAAEAEDVEEAFAAEDSSPRKNGKNERIAEAIMWLRQELAFESQPAETIKTAAKSAGHNRRALDAAKAELKIIVEPSGYQGAWHWRLPQ
jgi:hypothetical protein